MRGGGEVRGRPGHRPPGPRDGAPARIAGVMLGPVRRVRGKRDDGRQVLAQVVADQHRALPVWHLHVHVHGAEAQLVVQAAERRRAPRLPGTLRDGLRDDSAEHGRATGDDPQPLRFGRGAQLRSRPGQLAEHLPDVQARLGPGLQLKLGDLPGHPPAQRGPGVGEHSLRTGHHEPGLRVDDKEFLFNSEPQPSGSSGPLILRVHADAA